MCLIDKALHQGDADSQPLCRRLSDHAATRDQQLRDAESPHISRTTDDRTFQSQPANLRVLSKDPPSRFARLVSTGLLTIRAWPCSTELQISGLSRQVET